jgi:hypothetical protein
MQQVADVSTLSHRSASTAVCTVRAPSSSATECLLRELTSHFTSLSNTTLIPPEQ